MCNAYVRSLLLLSVSSLISLNALSAQAAGHDQTSMTLKIAMMGGNLMGPGMMGSSGASQSSSNNGSASEVAAKPLEAYIGNRHLTCFSCHAVTGNGMGPPFVEIAHRYKGQSEATNILADSIAQGVSGKWQGYPGMPGGLASHQQARELAHLIMDLSETQ